MQKAAAAQIERRKKKRAKNKPARQRAKRQFKQIVRSYNALSRMAA